MRLLIACLIVAVVSALPSHKHRSIKGTPRIVGGTDATYGQFPYQATLQDGSFGFNYHICGATIYTVSWVITAGHCVFHEDIANPSYLTIVGGDHTLYVNDGFEQSSVLSTITINPDFNEYTYSSDVAVLKLATPFTFDTPYVQPILLPSSGQTFTGNCIVSGWGLTSENGDPPLVLQEVSLPIMSDADCRVIYGDPDVESSMLCAGGEAGKGGCQGDSGGPFACDDGTGTFYLAGIASWGYKCGVAGYPDVFAEVSYFSKWISNNTP